MKNDAELYLMLVRTAGMARRTPSGSDTDTPRKWHGYGHILDTLIPNEGMSQQSLASAIGIRPQSLSEALAVMEDRGFVRREPCESDKRVTLVYLTEAGIGRRIELSLQREAKARRFLACLDDDEKQTLGRLLKKLSESAQDEEEDI